MYVIGTAGHVDHGKSALIEAVTGTHPDRLQEEREREMSIVLGFDSFVLPDGKQISIVDVPGHRDFIENMLSGVGGIDASIFVIAADEGVMPQTREHLAILDLLGIDCGVVAITKTDLIDDPEWLDLIELDIHDLLDQTVLKEAPIIRVSAKSGDGIPALLQAISKVLEAKEPRPDLGRPRLSVDRAFVVAGFGTVVTGTLLDGSLRVGDEVIVLPKGIRGRIRGLQSHNQNQELVKPGTRAAINISGVDLQEIDRGDTVAIPDHYQPTRRLAVAYRHLSNLNKPLFHNTEAKLFIGADESIARIRLLGARKMMPGDNGWLQLEVSQPVITQRGDHYILRQPSPSETIGGGIVVESHPPRRYKRFNDQTISHLVSLTSENPLDIIQQILSREGLLAWEDLLKRTNLDEVNVAVAVEQLLSTGFAELIHSKQGKGRWVSAREQWQEIMSGILERIDSYHHSYPLRFGMPREELKSQSSLSNVIFTELISQLLEEKKIIQKGPLIAAPDHKVNFSSQQEKQVAGLLDQFSKTPHTPPTVSESKKLVGEEVYVALVGLGKLKQISAEVVFAADTYQEMAKVLRDYLEREGQITVAEARDLFQSSRRYILAFLESMDEEGVTEREGDYRRLKGHP